MKNLKKGMYAIAFCFVMVAGFLMPRTILHVQDLRLEVQVDSYGLNNAPLRQSSHLLERMKAIQEEMVELTQTEQPRLNHTSIYPVMMEGIDAVGLYKVAEDMIVEWNAKPKQMISKDGTLSFIVWDCSISMEKGDIWLTVDDATGKLLKINEFIYDDWYIDRESYAVVMTDSLTNYYACDRVEQITDNGYVDVDSVTGAVVTTDGMDGSDTTEYDSYMIRVKYCLTDGEFQTEINCQLEKNYDTTYLIMNGLY